MAALPWIPAVCTPWADGVRRRMAERGTAAVDCSLACLQNFALFLEKGKCRGGHLGGPGWGWPGMLLEDFIHGAFVLPDSGTYMMNGGAE